LRENPYAGTQSQTSHFRLYAFTNKFANDYPQLSSENKEIVGKRVGKLLAYIEEQPKSFKWKMGSKVGMKTVWHNPVEDR
jgi:hypothetical protein